ncbi:hypothetical protein F5B19DRAFT_447693 [Rostrohypoxylon terebratum]|nr:hypothetical protein F5B19DRAFT_447693 [Rostrohypoxylon terebratum]
MLFSLLIIGFTAAIGSASPFNQSEPGAIMHGSRMIIRGTCRVSNDARAPNGVCYEHYGEMTNGWVGNCDPEPYDCRGNGNFCTISTTPGGVVMCS